MHRCGGLTIAWCPYSICEDRSSCSTIWKRGFWRTLTAWLVQFVVLDEKSKFEMFFPNGSVMQLVCTAFRIMISCLPPALYVELAHFLVRPCRTEFASCIDFNVRAAKGCQPARTARISSPCVAEHPSLGFQSSCRQRGRLEDVDKACASASCGRKGNNALLPHGGAVITNCVLGL